MWPGFDVFAGVPDQDLKATGVALARFAIAASAQEADFRDLLGRVRAETGAWMTKEYGREDAGYIDAVEKAALAEFARLRGITVPCAGERH